MQLVQVMRKCYPIVEAKTADGLIVELEDPLPEPVPEHKAFRGEFDDTRALVFLVCNAFDQTVTFEPLQHAIEILGD